MNPGFMEYQSRVEWAAQPTPKTRACAERIAAFDEDTQKAAAKVLEALQLLIRSNDLNESTRSLHELSREVWEGVLLDSRPLDDPMRTCVAGLARNVLRELANVCSIAGLSLASLAEEDARALIAERIKADD